MLAMDILAIQGSTVPCEHVFSSGKKTMSVHYSWIKYDLMEALQILKYSLSHNCKLNFTAGTGQSDKLKKLEDFDFIDSAIPEDLMAFQYRLTLSSDD